MATELGEIKGILESSGTIYSLQGEDTVICKYETTKYKNSQGKSSLTIKIHLLEDGEFLVFRAPFAFSVARERIESFSRACLILQKRAKLLRFEYDAADGEVAAVIELPLEDAKLTKEQFQRCLRVLKSLLDAHYEDLVRVAETGSFELSHANPKEAAEVIDRLAAAVPKEVLEKALEKAAHNTPPVGRSISPPQATDKADSLLPRDPIQLRQLQGKLKRSKRSTRAAQ